MAGVTRSPKLHSGCGLASCSCLGSHGDLWKYVKVHAGFVDRLAVSRTGHFSCPVLAGVIFLAHFDGDAVRSSQDVFNALQVDPVQSVQLPSVASRLALKLLCHCWWYITFG